MKRWLLIPLSLLAGGISILFTMVMAIVVILSTYCHRREWEDRVVMFWSKGLLLLAGVRVRVFGLEKLPRAGVIFVFNHFSLYDIPVIHAVVPKSFRFGAKAELFKIPIFGPSMARAKALKIERSNLNSVIRVYDEARDRVSRGESFILAPEGTRQKDARIGEFKTGPFILAINAKAPIVPIVLKNVEKVIPKGHLLLRYDWPRIVELHILDPIPTAHLTLENREELKDKTRAIMVQAFLQPNSNS